MVKTIQGTHTPFFQFSRGTLKNSNYLFFRWLQFWRNISWNLLMVGTKSETCIQDNSCIGKWKRKVKNWIHAIFHWLLLYDVLKLLANSTMHLTLMALFTKIWCYQGEKNVVKISIFIHKNLKYQKQQINTRESQWRGNCSFKKHPQLVLYLHY